VSNKFLTPPEIPEGTVCRAFLVPDSTECEAIFRGALLELSYADSWEQIDGITPQEAADLWWSSMEQFLANPDCPEGSGVMLPVGSIFFAGFAATPDKCLPCDGASYLRTAYPELFAAIGISFGAEDVDHFNVPDLRGRSPLGTGQGPGLSNRALGDMGGEENHALTTAENAPHTHTVHRSATDGQSTNLIKRAATPETGTNETDSSGSGTAHNTMHPFLAFAFFIIAET
jgi:microcystin-dependent protein